MESEKSTKQRQARAKEGQPESVITLHSACAYACPMSVCFASGCSLCCWRGQ